MPKFYLQSICEDGTTTTKSFESVFLNDTVEYCADFLKGVGFEFEELKVENPVYDEHRNIVPFQGKTNFAASDTPTVSE